MFDPSQYHLSHINDTDDILEHVLSEFRKWHFFRHVFSRKKLLFQCHILRQHSFMSFRSQKLGSKYVIDGILKEGVESFNFGIKVSILKNFAKANKINLSSQSYFSLGNKSLSDLINEGTIYLECWMTGATLKRLMKKEKSRKAFYSKYK